MHKVQMHTGAIRKLLYMYGLCAFTEDNPLANLKLADYLPVHVRGSRRVCQRESNSYNVGFFVFFFFLVDEGRGSKYHLKRAIIGTPAKRH